LVVSSTFLKPKLWFQKLATNVDGAHLSLRKDNQQTGSRLQDLIEVFKDHAGWQELGHLSWEDFCERRLQKSPTEVETEVTLRAQTKARAMEPAKLNPPQTNGASDNCNMQFGNSADYLTARIARDHPEILESMKEGKYRSVRQAAIEAGIVNAKTRYSLSDEPVGVKYL
jgi:hypothetical protein